MSELDISLLNLLRSHELSVPGIGYAMERGELIIRENNQQLLE